MGSLAYSRHPRVLPHPFHCVGFQGTDGLLGSSPQQTPRFLDLDFTTSQVIRNKYLSCVSFQCNILLQQTKHTKMIAMRVFYKDVQYSLINNCNHKLNIQLVKDSVSKLQRIVPTPCDDILITHCTYVLVIPLINK